MEVTMLPITKLFLDEALNKEVTGLTKRAEQLLTKSFSGSPAYQIARKGQEILEKKKHEVVYITSYDGLKLVGHWFECKNAKRTVVAMHGWRSVWSRDYSTSADFIMGNDCNVLYAEERAQGASEGNYMTFGYAERHDAAMWAKFADEKTGGTLPVYFLGVSMGAATVMMAADLELPKTMRGIIADCGFTSMESIFKHVCEDMLHLSYKFREKDVKKEIKARTGFEIDEVSTTDTLARSNLPVLLIHGEDDDFVPVEETYKNKAVLGDRATVLIVPGANHALSYWVDVEKYKKAVLDFFAAND